MLTFNLQKKFQVSSSILSKHRWKQYCLLPLDFCYKLTLILPDLLQTLRNFFTILISVFLTSTGVMQIQIDIYQESHVSKENSNKIRNIYQKINVKFHLPVSIYISILVLKVAFNICISLLVLKHFLKIRFSFNFYKFRWRKLE